MFVINFVLSLSVTDPLILLNYMNISIRLTNINKISKIVYQRLSHFDDKISEKSELSVLAMHFVCEKDII